jgi:hypothetical protein
MIPAYARGQSFGFQAEGLIRYPVTHGSFALRSTSVRLREIG